MSVVVGTAGRRLTVWHRRPGGRLQDVECTVAVPAGYAGPECEHRTHALAVWCAQSRARCRRTRHRVVRCSCGLSWCVLPGTQLWGDERSGL